MRLTVVVPIYNVEKYIKKCIDSIIAQTYKDIDIILVDDGSTDASGKIADKYAKEYKFIEVIHQENRGLSAARNTGIDNCKTELITFVDSDDYIENNMYEDLIDRMEIYKADVSIGGVYREDINGNRKSIYPKNIEKVFSREEGLIELNSLKYFNMSVCNVVFKTKLFNTIGFDEEMVRFPLGKKSEDEFTTHKVFARANKIAYTSEPYYHYLNRPNSITTSSSINVDQLEAAKVRVEFYEKWFPEIVYSAKSELLFTCMGLTNNFINRGMEGPKELNTKLHIIAKDNVRYVVKNNHVSSKKKIQTIIYTYCNGLYRIIIKNTRKKGR